MLSTRIELNLEKVSRKFLAKKISNAHRLFITCKVCFAQKPTTPTISTLTNLCSFPYPETPERG